MIFYTYVSVYQRVSSKNIKKIHEFSQGFHRFSIFNCYVSSPRVSHDFSHPHGPKNGPISPGRAAGFHPTDGLLGDQQRRRTPRDGRGADGDVHLRQDLPAAPGWKTSGKNGKTSGKWGKNVGKGWILEKKTDLLADLFGGNHGKNYGVQALKVWT